jgi:YfiH family protein
MFIEKDEYFELQEFEDFGIRAIYTTKKLGDVRNKEDRENIIKILNIENKKIYSGFQTHSSNVEVIEENTDIYLNDVDGFITQRKDIVIFTKYADCLPIYIYDKKNEVFGCVHSGWQGTFKGIIIKAINLMQKRFKSKLENIKIAFGIGISYEKYEVSLEFYEKFQKNFKEEVLNNTFFFEEGKYYFDNQKLNYNLLLELGIKKENIITNDLCTYVGPFHSYRRDKEGSGRNGAYIFVDKTRK